MGHKELIDKVEEMIVKILEENFEALDNWRKQELTTSHWVKNFENWILVELVNQLLKSGMIKEENGKKKIRTNGFIDNLDLKEKPSDLKGPKAGSTSLSPDLSFETTDGLILDIEIKTQGHPQEIEDDVKIVKFLNEKKISSHKALFLWIVLAPEKDIYARSVWNTVENTIKIIKAHEVGFKEGKVDNKEMKKWLRWYIIY
jgi:hypothetical protein